MMRAVLQMEISISRNQFSPFCLLGILFDFHPSLRRDVRFRHLLQHAEFHYPGYQTVPQGGQGYVPEHIYYDKLGDYGDYLDRLDADCDVLSNSE